MQYQLDGDVEYHNPAEPSTTSCPLLPGQPVNVLDVPMQIGDEDSRARSGSTSAVTAATCTMNPEDKYLNPRPAPIPTLPRLTTSQTSLHGPTDHSSSPRYGRSPWSARSGKNSSSSGSPVNFSRLLSYARKASAGRASRSLSPRRDPRQQEILGFSSAPKTADAIFETNRGRRGFGRVGKQPQISDPVLISTTNHSRYCMSLRDTHSEPPSRLSDFQDVRAEAPSFLFAESFAKINTRPPQLATRSKSQEPSSLRNAVYIEDLALGVDDSDISQNKTDLEDKSNTSNTPLKAHIAESHLAHATGIDSRVNLPEVVTTASSSTSQNSQTCSKSSLGYLPNLAIDFEADHAETFEPHALSMQADRPQFLRSHFSEWSTATITQPPPSTFSMNDHTSPSLSYATDPSSDPSSPCRLSTQFDTPLPSELDDHMFASEYTAHSDVYLQNQSTNESKKLPLNNLHIATADLHPQATGFDIRGFQGYSLPQEEYASELTLRKPPTPGFAAPLPQPATGSQNGADKVQCWNDGSEDRLSAMDELFNDLGYLGGVILRK